jgi:hypothetical protein
MLRSLIFIKVVHSLAFWFLSVANLIVLSSALSGRISTLTWVALGVLLIEGIVLILNGWQCPLRTYAEDIGAVSGQVTDIFLPKWFANRIFPICGGLLAFSVLLLVVRLLTGTLR